jgi:hypothetical protein
LCFLRSDARALKHNSVHGVFVLALKRGTCIKIHKKGQPDNGVALKIDPILYLTASACRSAARTPGPEIDRTVEFESYF